MASNTTIGTDLSETTAVGRRKTVRDAEKTRAKVLAAAAVEMTENGYGSARIDRIAQRAGVNKQLIYYYFGSKENLYVAVLEDAYSTIRAAEAKLRLEDLDPVQAVTELARFTWQYHVEHPDLISLVRTENLHKAKYLKRSARLAGINSPLLAAITGILRRGAEAGVFRPDADALDLYLTIASLSIYSLANHWTLETNFGRKLLTRDRLKSWGLHIVEVTLSYLAPRAARLEGVTLLQRI